MDEELIIMDKLKAKEADLERGLSETTVPTGMKLHTLFQHDSLYKMNFYILLIMIK